MEETKQENVADDPIGKIDFRVGKIVSVARHENADTLYVEKVDVGKEELVTVVSGLAGKIPVESLEGILAVFVTNLKPVSM
ncbi:MAG: aminoacyl tRNA synthase complex-interacting multifunctional protein 1, partial [Amphiamblys sp. WSBS2006]